ncbi:hypothetical protein WM28_12380 [Burkholderia ubonensis]|uniref:hypothetical protein n=1 Tax=Burkholderia ubonensis TaxID=101571 RepID=UPI00075FB37B|nr:hypothetical protein [Burkholderia ubonensis]KWO51755.1 hypothetical protein WM28_12380 [Burkholderia ubonensis]
MLNEARVTLAKALSRTKRTVRFGGAAEFLDWFMSSGRGSPGIQSDCVPFVTWTKETIDAELAELLRGYGSAFQTNFS